MLLRQLRDACREPQLLRQIELQALQPGLLGRATGDQRAVRVRADPQRAHRRQARLALDHLEGALHLGRDAGGHVLGILFLDGLRARNLNPAGQAQSALMNHGQQRR